MNMKKTVPILAVVVVGIIIAWMIIAMDRGSHGKPTEGEAKGPHGGRWLSEGDFQVEVTIYEREAVTRTSAARRSTSDLASRKRSSRIAP